jgi:hypothetical protein
VEEVVAMTLDEFDQRLEQDAAKWEVAHEIKGTAGLPMDAPNAPRLLRHARATFRERMTPSQVAWLEGASDGDVQHVLTGIAYGAPFPEGYQQT